MKRNPLQRVRAASTRVALIATAIVGVAYIIVAASVVVIASSKQTSEVDGKLTGLLSASQFHIRCTGGGLPLQPSPYETPFVYWLVGADGSVIRCSNLALPEGAGGVGVSPQTYSVAGTDMRMVGKDVQLQPPDGPTYHLVVGQTLSNVITARNDIILAEVLVGPILLIAVFLGAMTIGRRVAAPIELARQRQMEFTADASHELRTPLSVIEAQTSLALSQERDNAWYRDAFMHVGHESQRIRRLVEDLLWLARFDVTSGQPHAEHVDIGILAHQAADRFATVAEARHLMLNVRAAAEPMIILAPPEWLDRLLGVLLDNACKYAPENGSVEVVVAAEGGRVRLAVEDSGPGIPAQERGRIFDRFHRATDRPGGAGLGLAIADAVVRATGGRWDVGSAAAGGASMAVSWNRSLPATREPSFNREAVSPAH